MGTTVMGAMVSLDGFIADDNDGVGLEFQVAPTTPTGCSRFHNPFCHTRKEESCLA